MNNFSAALGSLRTMANRGRGGRKHHAKRHISRLPHLRDLRLEQLEDRALLSIGGTPLTHPTSLIGPVLPVADSPVSSSVKVLPNTASASSLSAISDVLSVATPAPKLQSTTGGNSLVASSLRDMQNAIQTQISQGKAALHNLSTDSIHVDDAGRIQVYVSVAAVTNSVINALSSAGLAVQTSNADMRVVQGWVSNSSLDALAAVAGVQSIAPPVYAVVNTGSVTTAGDAILNAASVRSQFAAYGIDGSGVKVGVISDGVTHRANSQATGDLPATITINPSLPGNGDEGTAMLEIIHDEAPGAQLYFSGTEAGGSFTSADMVNDINWLVSQGCKVIVDDVGFLDQPFFQDGAVATAAANAVSAGVDYVTAAGNYADAHFQGQYQPYSGTTYQTFYVNGTTALNILPVPTTAGYVEGALEWSDPWGGSGNNYDLYLFGWNGSSWVQVASSTTVQSGTQNPWEFVGYNNTMYSQMGWVINKASGASRELELYFSGSGIAGYYTNVSYTAADSIFGQGAVPSVIAVGAIDASDSGNDTVESFSSRGPSTIYINFSTQTKTLRQSLAGCGIDGVQTEVGQLGYFENPFYGTSAAAPSVAAIAALLRDVNPSLTPAQVATDLDNTAVDLTAYGSGYDNTSGYGRFDALGAAYAAFTPSAPQLAPGSDSGKFNNDGITNVTTPTITGSAPLASFVHVYVDGVEKGTQQLGSGQSIYSITTSTLTAGTHVITVKMGASSSTLTANLSNVSPATTVTIDTTVPTLTWGTPTPAANAAGWNNTDVSVPYTAADVSSGVDTSLPASPLVLSTEGNAVTGTVTVTDLAGNSAIFTAGPFKIDKTAPTLTWGTPTPAANAAGWNNTDVSVPYTTADVWSGVTSSLPASPLVLSAEGNAVTGTVTVTDAAGNSAIFTAGPFMIDKTAPTVTSSTPSTAGPTNAESLTFTVVFDETVSNVTTDDFQLTTTGTANGEIASVDASSGTSFTVTVDTIRGDGALRLDLSGGTDVQDASGNIAVAYTGGDTVTIDKTRTWDGGGGTDHNWTNPANWADDVAPVAGDRLVFAADTPTDSFNDFPELPEPTMFDSITFQNGDFTLSGNAVVLDPQGGVAIDNVLGHNSVALQLTLAPAATATAIVEAGVLQLGSDAQFPLLTGGSANITGGALILDYTTGSDLASTVRSLLATAYNGGVDPFHTGQITDTIASSTVGLGWADSPTINGHAYTNQIVVMPALYGDATLDGTVDGYDLGKVLSSYTQTGMTWAEGDFTYDGTVDGYDLSKILGNYTHTGPVALDVSGYNLDATAIPASSGVGITAIAGRMGPGSRAASSSGAVTFSAAPAQIGAAALAAVKGVGQAAATVSTPAKVGQPVPAAGDGDGVNVNARLVAAAITQVSKTPGSVVGAADHKAAADVPPQAQPKGRADAQLLRDAVFSRWAAVGWAHRNARELLATGDDENTDVPWDGQSEWSVGARVALRSRS